MNKCSICYKELGELDDYELMRYSPRLFSNYYDVCVSCYKDCKDKDINYLIQLE